jgi:hypothetical protein
MGDQAVTTPGNIIQNRHTGITASSGIPTQDPGVSAANTVHVLYQAALVIGNRRIK